MDVHEFLRVVTSIKTLRRVELEAEISDEKSEELERELTQREIEFARVNTQQNYLVATEEDVSKDKYDFNYMLGETAYLIEDHGRKQEKKEKFKLFDN